MRAEMEAQLREELAARSGGSSTISEEQLVAMRAEAEEKARAEAQRLQDEAAKMKRRWGGCSSRGIRYRLPHALGVATRVHGFQDCICQRIQAPRNGKPSCPALHPLIIWLPGAHFAPNLLLMCTGRPT